MFIEYTVYYEVDGTPQELGKISGLCAISTMFIMSTLSREIREFKTKFEIADFRPEKLSIGYNMPN